MENNKQSELWTIIGVVAPFLLSLAGWVAKMIISPRLKIKTPKRVFRSWAPFFAGKKPDFFDAGGTATHDYIYHMRQEERLSADDVNARYFIHLPIENDTPFRFDITTANKIRAKLTFYDLDRNKIGEFDAKWENANQVMAAGNKEVTKFMSIDGGKVENLDIASRRVTGNDWYVMNGNSYDNPINSEIQSNKIGSGGFIVKIELSGQNIRDKKKTYKMIDNGGKEPDFFEINDKDL